ncbi:MAG: RNA methyltransferase [Paludibacteraceae bacterium]|nr:RNA methyltransferase [Paludibacteraceae bacterium]
MTTIKHVSYMKQQHYVAKTYKGLEEVLAAELTRLGATRVETGNRAVTFDGDLRILYKANLQCRTALRILCPLFSFQARNADEIYDQVKAYDWSSLMTVKSTFLIETTVHSEVFRHSKFATYRVKDAIVDQFYESTGKRPSISVSNPEFYLNLHISDTTCTLSLDSSGEPLNRRGYRVGQTEAPVNEVLAAGMLLLAGWDGQCDFIDPMCGSGTIAIEAALIARNIAPGIFRQHFAFEKWADFDADLFEELYNDESGEREFTHRIFASDIDPKAVAVASENIKQAGLASMIDLQVADFTKMDDHPQPMLLLTNPPYGQRIGDQVEELYQAVGSTLKHHFTRTEAWIISSNDKAMAQIGLRPSGRIPLLNGDLECELRHYTLFAGKRSDFRKAGGQVTRVERPASRRPRPQNRKR